MIIRPTYPPVLRPTIDAIAPSGGLPWEQRGGGSVWVPSALGSQLKLDLPPEAYSTGAAGWVDPVRGHAFTAAAGKRPATRLVNGIAVPDFDGVDDGLVGPSLETIWGTNGSIELHIAFVGDAFAPNDDIWLMPPLFRTHASARFGITIDEGALQVGMYDGVNFREAYVLSSPVAGTVYRARVSYVAATSIDCRFKATDGTRINGDPSGQIDVQNGATCLGTTEGVAGTFFFNGGVCHVIGTSILSAADKALVDAYFVRRYGAVL